MPSKVTVEWTVAAEDDLLLVIAKIAAENPIAATDLLDEIREKAQGLSETPKLYAFSQRAKRYRQLNIRQRGIHDLPIDDSSHRKVCSLHWYSD